jgi:hypothetical protein
MFKWIAVAVLCGMGPLSAVGAAAAEVDAIPAGSASRPIVMELFTSQGCSSCPPADALLGRLAAEPDVIALAFHVQYWDDLGWSDRFGLSEAAARQQRYVQQLHLASGFTPQLIIDADRSLVGSDRDRIYTILKRLRTERRHATVIRANVSDGRLQVMVPADAAPPAGAEVLLLPFLPVADTAIGRGENARRTLREFDIVRATRVMGLWHGSAARYDVALASLPPDATRAAVLLQTRGQGVLLGATVVTLH